MLNLPGAIVEELGPSERQPWLRPGKWGRGIGLLVSGGCLLFAAACLGSEFLSDDFGGSAEDPAEFGILASTWHPEQGNWEVRQGVLMGSFSTGGGASLQPALLLATESDLSGPESATFEVVADVAVRSESTAHSAGLAARVSPDSADYYVLRFNLRGVVQLIRTGSGDSVLLEEKQVGRLLSGQPYRLTLRSVEDGKFEWRMESPLRVLAEGLAEDADPPPHGGMVGLWTNAASRDGEPTALFRLFAFHRKAHGLEENLPFLEEIDPRDFPPVEFPELP
jgi:hypothetical protein